MIGGYESWKFSRGNSELAYADMSLTQYLIHYYFESRFDLLLMLSLVCKNRMPDGNLGGQRGREEPTSMGGKRKYE
jgi:hypothetical protein